MNDLLAMGSLVGFNPIHFLIGFILLCCVLAIVIIGIPSAVLEFVPVHPDVVPEPVAVLVEAIKQGKVAEIVLLDPEPTVWERFKNWWSEE